MIYDNDTMTKGIKPVSVSVHLLAFLVMINLSDKTGAVYDKPATCQEQLEPN
jgi:hypothetical protein